MSVAAASPQVVPFGFVPTYRLGQQAAKRLRKLSVLMPIYNERLTLEAALARVLKQPLEIGLEVVAVDDGSDDGSWETLTRIAERDPRVIPLRHERNQGKGAAIRTAIARMTGDVAVIQDADLEYDPADWPRLIAPIASGQADAVFGSRFGGETRRVLFYWHAVANRLLTWFSNMVSGLNLSDMETGAKMIRGDVLRHLALRANTFTIEPELTVRLAQWGARIYETPISYFGRTYAEGKKIRLRDAFKACWQLLRSGFLDKQFTRHAGFYILSAVAHANKYNRYTLDKVRKFLGPRLLEAGSGIGSVSQMFLHRERLLLADYEPVYVARLRDRFGHLPHVEVAQADLTAEEPFDDWSRERLDTIFSSNVIEHIEDDAGVLARFQRVLEPGGHCVIVVPACPGLYTGVDAELGHFRRYTQQELCGKMQAAGFEVVHAEQFNKLGAIGWWVSGKIFRRRRLNPSQMIWFDRLLWLARWFERVPLVPGMSLIVVGRKPSGAAGRDSVGRDSANNS